MNLFEEYYQRHKLECPAIYRVTNKSYVLFRSEPKIWKTNWVLMCISQRAESFCPSYFSISLSIPRRNGIILGNFFTQVGEGQSRIEWDQYDKELIRWASDMCYTKLTLPAKTKNESLLLAWEMFLYGIDDAFPSFTVETRRQIYRSLDAEMSDEIRLEAQAEALLRLQNEASENMYAARWPSIRGYAEPSSYAYWFATLCDRMSNSRYREDYRDLFNVA